ncbi:MAG: hypothetical protein QOG68_1609 [Solirubrobacteraceae bacterium]|nr:hypothetical protein [Solirubrobacteraceae bacterium]
MLVHTVGMRTLATILFDEGHSEAWTIRPEVAAEINPSHPADSSYARAAEILRAHDFAVEPRVGGPLGAAAVLVIAHPSDPKWERVVPGGSPLFSASEIDEIEAFVRGGGGLIVLAEEEQEKYGTNLAELTARFGIAVDNAVVYDYEHNHQTPSWVLADLVRDRAAVDLLARVDDVCFYRCGTLTPGAGARVLAHTAPTASTPGAPLLAVTEHGAGRVVVAADSDLFGDDCIDELGHADLWCNLVHWAAGPALAGGELEAPSDVASDPHWHALKTQTDALRLLQAPDGALADDEPRDAAAAHVVAMAAAIEGLAPRFAHDAEYLAAVVSDLRAWADGGYAKPDFAASLDLFRPDLHRVDGAEHLVVFPMYLQNSGSRDTHFEALVIRVPWPEWIARLEAAKYDNAKFVPVEFVDHTLGYDSESAVLFPETVSIAGAPANHFGAIFCDREAARFRRVSTEAAALLRLNLPPDAAALLASAPMSRDAYILWDLIHDRTHSHGDLPFDPFMIRQRMPYWMYSLEELRCDLTAFCEAVDLERGGFAFARHAQYAILFDRLFRFPITGNRVRNYDGLGGQLLFAYLHKHGLVHWTDNQLTIEWDRVADGVVALRAAVEELYRAGIDRSKLAHWQAAHDFVSTYVPPAAGSAWARDARDFADVEDPRPYIDKVLDDEFPLSMFYSSLKGKLDPAPPATAPA